jgi:hypothetical protein
MAGRGPAPKPAARRARRNVDPNPVTTILFEQGEQPDLPEGAWHPMTREWWRTWGESPQAEHFMAVDWSFLLDTAVFHNAVWNAKDEGRSATEAGKELRTRVQDFGATVASRLRLRMQFAEVDATDEKRGVKPSGSRSQYGPLRAV